MIFILFLIAFITTVQALIKPGEVLEIDTSKASKVHVYVGADNSYYVSGLDSKSGSWGSPMMIKAATSPMPYSSDIPAVSRQTCSVPISSNPPVSSAPISSNPPVSPVPTTTTSTATSHPPGELCKSGYTLIPRYVNTIDDHPFPPYVNPTTTPNPYVAIPNDDSYMPCYGNKEIYNDKNTRVCHLKPTLTSASVNKDNMTKKDITNVTEMKGAEGDMSKKGFDSAMSKKGLGSDMTKKGKEDCKDKDKKDNDKNKTTKASKNPKKNSKNSAISLSLSMGLFVILLSCLIQ